MRYEEERMHVIKLTEYECLLAAEVGMRRNAEARFNRRKGTGGQKGLGWDTHIEGAMGELVVAKHLNRYWDGSVNTFKAGGDVGHLQVRTTGDHARRLIVRDCDRDDDIFILVTGVSPEFVIRGYILGREAKKYGQYYETIASRPPAFFIPQRLLRPLPPDAPSRL